MYFFILGLCASYSQLYNPNFSRSKSLLHCTELVYYMAIMFIRALAFLLKNIPSIYFFVFTPIVYPFYPKKLGYGSPVTTYVAEKAFLHSLLVHARRSTHNQAVKEIDSSMRVQSVPHPPISHVALLPQPAPAR